jgi:uncharacterized protein (TIGR02271 family)
MPTPEWTPADRERHAVDTDAEPDTELPRTLELREEQFVARKHMRELGEVELRTEIEEHPGRLEVDAYREEVVIEHEPVGEVVRERREPWEEDGVLIIPIYEEQLVVTKRLLLRERMRVRRVTSTERQLFEDTLRRERLVVDDSARTGLVREQYPTDGPDAEADDHAHADGGLLGHLVRKALD